MRWWHEKVGLERKWRGVACGVSPEDGEWSRGIVHLKISEQSGFNLELNLPAEPGGRGWGGGGEVGCGGEIEYIDGEERESERIRHSRGGGGSEGQAREDTALY